MLRTIKQICQNSELKTFNKANITVTVDNGNFVPASCIKDSRSIQCVNENRLAYLQNVNDVVADQEKLKQGRSRIMQALNRWIENLSTRLQLVAEHSDQYAVITQTLMQQLIELKWRILSAKLTKKLQGGNCGEITSVALEEILKLRRESNQAIDVKAVMLKNKAQEVNHYFLLINNNLPKVENDQGQTAINKYLSKDITGYICDPWNKGVFSRINYEKSGLYFNNSYWDEIMIEDFNFPQHELDKLPLPLREIFSELFAELGVTALKVANPIPESNAIQIKPAAKPHNLGFFDRMLQSAVNYAHDLVDQCPAYFPRVDSVQHGCYWKNEQASIEASADAQQCVASRQLGK